MTLEFVSITVGLSLLFAAQTLLADDPDSIDAPRKEHRALRERLDPSEQLVQTLSRANARSTVTVIKLGENGAPDRWPRRILIPRRPGAMHSVDEVMRLQIESPESLLKGIFERERMLRRRLFYPEVIAR
jgi:hypothetical protein